MGLKHDVLSWCPLMMSNIGIAMGLLVTVFFLLTFEGVL